MLVFNLAYGTQLILAILQIVNRFLLLPQMIYRLEYIKEKMTVSKIGIMAERILADLTKEPESLLSPDIRRIFMETQPSLLSISDQEGVSIRQRAFFAHGGLPNALRELTMRSERPISIDTLRNVRVTLAMANAELHDSQEDWKLMQELWESQPLSLLSAFIDLFLVVSEGVTDQFTLHPPQQTVEQHLYESFLASNDILDLVCKLLPLGSPSRRSTTALVGHVVDVFVCTDAVDMLYSQSSPICSVAQQTRQSCITVVRTLCSSTTRNSSTPAASQVMRTLLQHGLQPAGDPAFHMLQVVCLIDHILPTPGDMEDDNSQQLLWARDVFANILPELGLFFASLDTENKVHIARRLAQVDRNIVGIGEWLLAQELRAMLYALHLINTVDAPNHTMLAYQVSCILDFLRDLLCGSKSTADWWMTAISTESDIAGLMGKCLNALVEAQVSTPHLSSIIFKLSEARQDLPPSLQAACLLALLRIAQFPGMNHEDWIHTFTNAVGLAHAVPSSMVDTIAYTAELSATLAAYVSTIGTISVIDESIASAIFQLLQLKGDSEPLSPVLSSAQRGHLVHVLERSLPAGVSGEARALITPIPASAMDVSTNVLEPLTDIVEVTMGQLEDLLRPSRVSPTTPVIRPMDHTPDVLAQVTVSPAALFRSPSATTGLTKTYVNNAFRELRTSPLARQNTSRMPSMHVDVSTRTLSPTSVLA
jgi:hypothetical protein